jgi:hypothetical protein
MGDFAAPGDKLRCIMNACVAVNAVLAVAAEEAAAAKAAARGGEGAARSPVASGLGSPPGGVGADEFLPALIYTVLHAGPRTRGLYSSLRVVSEFRPPAKLNGEEGYFFINVVSALQFARNVRAAQLNMGEEELRRAREDATVRWAREQQGGGGARFEGDAEFRAMLAGGGEGLPPPPQSPPQQPQAPPPQPAPEEAGGGLRASLQRITKELVAARAAAAGGAGAPSLDSAPAAMQGLLRAHRSLLRALAE